MGLNYLSNYSISFQFLVQNLRNNWGLGVTIEFTEDETNMADVGGDVAFRWRGILYLVR